MIVGGLLIAALIHLLPVSGVLGAGRLEVLYGVRIDDPNLLLAMRHRAVLFGLLGGLLGVAAFLPGLRGMALVAGLVADGAFVVLAAGSPVNPAMRRVLVADVVSLVCLVAAGVGMALEG